MPQRFQPLIDGHYYHVYNRGVEKRHIFTDIRSYKRLLDVIDYYQFEKPRLRFSHFISLNTEARTIYLQSMNLSARIISIICFVCMPNHFHLLLRQEKANGISHYMMRISDSYTKYFNTKNKRIGPLFQGQFKSVYIKNDDQLKHVSRYIHLNPHTSKLVRSFDDLLTYPWSSLIEYLSGHHHISNPSPILAFFASKENYKEFLRDNSDYQRHLHQIKPYVFDNSK